jgi:hypothetical protein
MHRFSVREPLSALAATRIISVATEIKHDRLEGQTNVPISSITLVIFGTYPDVSTLQHGASKLETEGSLESCRAEGQHKFRIT